MTGARRLQQCPQRAEACVRFWISGPAAAEKPGPVPSQCSYFENRPPEIDPFCMHDAETLIAAIHRDWVEAQGNYDEFGFSQAETLRGDCPRPF